MAKKRVKPSRKLRARWTPEAAAAHWSKHTEEAKQRKPHPLNKPSLDERLAYREKNYSEWWALNKDNPNIREHQTRLREHRRAVWQDLVVHFSHVFGEAFV